MGTLDFVLIPLTKGQFAKVSPHRFDFLMKWKWIASWDRKMNGYYALARSRKDDGLDCRYIRMHRVLTGCVENDGTVVDHINHDTLDNRDENLRRTTPSENCFNQCRIKGASSSGHRGVYWHKTKQKWQVAFTINRKQVHIGYFDSYDIACQMWSDCTKKHFELRGTMVYNPTRNKPLEVESV